jgi:hypothetical protein
MSLGGGESFFDLVLDINMYGVHVQLDTKKNMKNDKVGKQKK